MASFVCLTPRPSQRLRLTLIRGQKPSSKGDPPRAGRTPAPPPGAHSRALSGVCRGSSSEPTVRRTVRASAPRLGRAGGRAPPTRCSPSAAACKKAASKQTQKRKKRQFREVASQRRRGQPKGEVRGGERKAGWALGIGRTLRHFRASRPGRDGPAPPSRRPGAPNPAPAYRSRFFRNLRRPLSGPGAPGSLQKEPTVRELRGESVRDPPPHTRTSSSPVLTGSPGAGGGWQATRGARLPGSDTLLPFP